MNIQALDQTSFRRLADTCLAEGATDLHIKAGSLPVFRRARGALELDAPVVPNADFEAIRLAIFGQREGTSSKKDFTYENVRVRAIYYTAQGIPIINLRFIPGKVPPLDHLGYDQRLADNLQNPMPGLVLISGGACAGKTTTQAAILNSLNQKHSLHIRTFEEPTEYELKSDRCLITQQVVGVDVTDYHVGVALALMQDVNVMAFGECSTAETARAVLKAANLNMLVYCTVHAEDVPNTITRFIDEYPPADREEARRQLARCLKAVVAQKLIPASRRNVELGLPPLTVAYQAAIFKRVREGGFVYSDKDADPWTNLIVENKVHELHSRFLNLAGTNAQTLFMHPNFL